MATCSNEGDCLPEEILWMIRHRLTCINISVLQIRPKSVACGICLLLQMKKKLEKNVFLRTSKVLRTCIYTFFFVLYEYSPINIFLKLVQKLGRL